MKIAEFVLTISLIRIKNLFIVFNRINDVIKYDVHEVSFNLKTLFKDTDLNKDLY